MPAQHYTGDSTEFLEGVPARDLTASEFDALDADQQANVKGSPLYEEVRPDPKHTNTPKAPSPPKDGDSKPGE